jgi:hypothetical protein
MIIEKKKITDFPTTEQTPYRELWNVHLKYTPKEYKENGSFVNVDSGDTFVAFEQIESKIVYSDSLDFIKVFKPTIVGIKDLNAMGKNVLIYIWSRLVKDTEIINLDLEAIREFAGYQNKKNVLDGILNLLQHGYLSRCVGNSGNYWINPNFFFNGDRKKIIGAKGREDFKKILDKGKQVQPPK